MRWVSKERPLPLPPRGKDSKITTGRETKYNPDNREGAERKSCSSKAKRSNHVSSKPMGRQRKTPQKGFYQGYCRSIIMSSTWGGGSSTGCFSGDQTWQMRHRLFDEFKMRHLSHSQSRVACKRERELRAVTRRMIPDVYFYMCFPCRKRCKGIALGTQRTWKRS